jgi:hypothetical protein
MDDSRLLGARLDGWRSNSPAKLREILARRARRDRNAVLQGTPLLGFPEWPLPRYRMPSKSVDNERYSD